MKTSQAYYAALREAQALLTLDPGPGTIGGVRLLALATELEAYETKHFPIAPPGVVAAIKFRKEQMSKRTDGGKA